ncbi:MAG: MEDS domain-containing protein [Nitrososphaera sp.]
MYGLDFLSNPPDDAHIALVYDRPEQRDALVARFINDGLEKGQVCAYGTVRYRVQGHLETMSSMIKDFDRHVKEGNLIIIDFAPFFHAAMTGDMKPFADAKKMLEEKLQGRKSKQARVIGDAVELMFDNDEFDPCASLEGWWQENFEAGITLCTYKRSSIRSNYHDIQFHRAVRATHDYVVDASAGSARPAQMSG